MPDHVKIFDTTLRDGEQSPGISLDVGEKLEIAEQLARLGVDVIEAGFPIASQGDFEAVEAIAKTVHGPTIAGLAHGVQRRRPGMGGGAPRREAPDPHLHRDVADPHEEEAPHDRGSGQGGDRRGGRPRIRLLHRRRVLARGRQPLRRRLPRRGVPAGGRQRCDHAQHPRHGRLRRTRGVRRADPLRHRPRPRRVRRLDALSQRPRPGCRELARGCRGRRAPGGVRDQRARRARRQCRAGRGRDGVAHAE